jgi:hypothetical protein
LERTSTTLFVHRDIFKAPLKKKKKVLTDTFLDGLQEVIVGLALVLEGEAAVGHVVQVLEPLEVGDGDTAGVDVQVGNDQHLLVAEDGVAGWRDRAVGSLGNDLGLLEKNILYNLPYFIKTEFHADFWQKNSFIFQE